MEDCPEGVLDKESIIKIYEQISDNGEGSKDFVERIFRIFDKDGSGSIDFKEFMKATDMTEFGTPQEKLRWAFKVRFFREFFVKSIRSLHFFREITVRKLRILNTIFNFCNFT